MGHVTPAPGTNQRRGRPGGHGGTHPVRLLEMLLCPIVGLWGALAAPLRAPLQRGRWPRSVCTPHSSCVAGGDRQVPESSGSSRCTGPRGDPREVAAVCPAPSPTPTRRPSPQQFKATISPDATSPGLGCNPRPLRSPLAPPRALEPRPARGGPGQCRCTRRPRPVRARCVSPQCICLRICPCVRPRVRPRICPRCICPRSICPRCVPASVGRRVCPRVRSRSHLAAQAEHLPGSAPAP